MLKPANNITNAVINNKFEHPHITQRMLDAANRCNLIHLLVWWDEEKLFVSNNTIRLKDHPHVQIYREASYNTETHQVLNAIETLRAYFALNFPQAYYVTQYFTQKVYKIQIRNYCQELSALTDDISVTSDDNLNSILNHNLLFDNDNTTARARCYAYLCGTKKIDRSIIFELIDRQLLTMNDDMMLNFLTYDKNDNVIASTRVSTLTQKPIKETYSVKRNVGFGYASKYYVGNQIYKTVFVYESCIDLLSFLTLQKRYDFACGDRGAIYISLEGLCFDRLNGLLKECPSIEKIVFCLGNDKMAIDAVSKYAKCRAVTVCDYQTKLRDFSLKYHYVENWNDLLQFMTPHVGTADMGRLSF